MYVVLYDRDLIRDDALPLKVFEICMYYLMQWIRCFLNSSWYFSDWNILFLISFLQMKFVLISSVINIVLCTTVIILSIKAMFYSNYSALAWYSETLTFAGFVIIFICLSTIISSAISIFKRPENMKRQEVITIPR